MTRKMAKSAPSTNVRAARGAGCRLHLVSALQEGRKSPNSHARSGVNWGIPDESKWAQWTIVSSSDYGSSRAQGANCQVAAARAKINNAH